MGNAARAHAPAETQHDASPPTPPNVYGGRLDANLRTPTSLDGGESKGIPRRELVAFFVRHLRRRWSPFTRVFLRVAIAVLEATDGDTGACDASTMGLAARARVARSSLFEALARLEGYRCIRERAPQDPHFCECLNTVTRGWKGFRACLKMRRAALAQGKPATCVAHHGRTTIEWTMTLPELEALARELEPKRVRKPKAPRRTEDPYRTPTPAPYRTAERNPYRTPTPGSGSLKTETTVHSYSPGQRPGACARDGRRATDDASRPALPGSSAPPPRAPSSPPVTPRPTEPTRATARSPHEPAFGGFASRNVAPDPQAAGEGTRAKPRPPSAPASAADVDAVLAAHREHAMRTTLARAPASRTERELVARELAGGATLDELIAAMRGLAGVDDPMRRRLVYVLRPDDDGVTTRLEHARCAGVERELADERRAARRRPPATPARDVVPVLDMAAYGRAEALRQAQDAFREASEAWSRDMSNGAAAAACNVARERLARLQGEIT